MVHTYPPPTPSLQGRGYRVAVRTLVVVPLPEIVTEASGGAYSEAGVYLGLVLLVVINRRHDDRERDL